MDMDLRLQVVNIKDVIGRHMKLRDHIYYVIYVYTLHLVPRHHRVVGLIQVTREVAGVTCIS